LEKADLNIENGIKAFFGSCLGTSCSGLTPAIAIIIASVCTLRDVFLDQPLVDRLGCIADDKVAAFARRLRDNADEGWTVILKRAASPSLVQALWWIGRDSFGQVGLNALLCVWTCLWESWRFWQCKDSGFIGMLLHYSY
jgi:hypothetical protein